MIRVISLARRCGRVEIMQLMMLQVWKHVRIGLGALYPFGSRMK
jgi:hypothetical protein